MIFKTTTHVVSHINRLYIMHQFIQKVYLQCISDIRRYILHRYLLINQVFLIIRLLVNTLKNKINLIVQFRHQKKNKKETALPKIITILGLIKFI